MSYHSNCLNNFVEQDGCARTVLMLLLLTTVGCITYTWGYYEGISNAQSVLVLERMHDEKTVANELAAAAHKGSNETAPKKGFHTGHGLRDLDPTRLEGAPGVTDGGMASGDDDSFGAHPHGVHVRTSTTPNGAEGQRERVGRGDGSAQRHRGEARYRNGNKGSEGGGGGGGHDNTLIKNL